MLIDRAQSLTSYYSECFGEIIKSEGTRENSNEESNSSTEAGFCDFTC